jgi:hypothetical protein
VAREKWGATEIAHTADLDRGLDMSLCKPLAGPLPRPRSPIGTYVVGIRFVRPHAALPALIGPVLAVQSGLAGVRVMRAISVATHFSLATPFSPASFSA